MTSIPVIFHSVCRDMICAGVVDSAEQFDAELTKLSGPYKVGPDELTAFIQLKIFEYDCVHKKDKSFISQMNKHLDEIDQMRNHW